MYFILVVHFRIIRLTNCEFYSARILYNTLKSNYHIIIIILFSKVKDVLFTLKEYHIFIIHTAGLSAYRFMSVEACLRI